MKYPFIIPIRQVNEDEVEYEEDDELSLHDAIMMSHHVREVEGIEMTTGTNATVTTVGSKQRKQLKPDSYFSDEDANSD